MIGPYSTSQAFRSALEARLRNVAHRRGIDLQRLRRRVAFDRLLARLFSEDDPLWILKGGYALELRLEDRARSTLDLDISVPHPDLLRMMATAREGISDTLMVYNHVQQAAERDLQDGFRFLIAAPTKELAGAPGGGIRCPIEAHLAERRFESFRLDVGLGDEVLDQPDWVEGGSLLGFAGIAAPRIAIYPVAQQFAEKVHAYTFPWQGRGNTRVKDLVDLVLLIHTTELESESVRQALVATFTTRSTHQVPARLPQPPAAWAEPYASLARELRLPPPTLSEAHTYLEDYWQRWGLDQINESDSKRT